MAILQEHDRITSIAVAIDRVCRVAREEPGREVTTARERLVMGREDYRDQESVTEGSFAGIGPQLLMRTADVKNTSPED